MTKPPNSFRRSNKTTAEFDRLFAKLDKEYRRAARASCKTYRTDPAAKSLRWHRLKDTRSGRHLSGSISISITLRHRAIGIEDDETGITYWYWVGTHAEYDIFTGG